MAVLAIKFARTVAFAESICDFIRKPTQRIIVPTLLKACPEKYGKWVPVLTKWITKLVAVSAAFYATSVIVAFTSAITGALIMTRSFMKIARKKGWTLADFCQPMIKIPFWTKLDHMPLHFWDSVFNGN